MKAYIQSHENGIPHNYNFMNAYQGFYEVGLIVAHLVCFRLVRGFFCPSERNVPHRPTLQYLYLLFLAVL